MSLDVIRELAIDHWNPSFQDVGPGGQEENLESGKVLYFPRLNFAMSDVEQRFLTEQWSDGKAKNISYRGTTSTLHGAQGDPADLEQIKTMVARYAASAQTLVHTLFPRYRGFLKPGFTSYRTAAVEGRVTSWRKDDTRLHVDAFPSNPTGGMRLIRVFTNVNPAGAPRVWRVGEPFPTFAMKFFPRCVKPIPGSAWLLHKLGVTKSRRSEYDHYMGQLHDEGKADLDYQKTSPQLTFGFPAGASWVVFSDQVQHAVMSGQYMLEQTFYLNPEHQVHPESGPLKILEKLAGHSLRH
jgi:hypothetical protein